jgi:hypoxanthine phosphoribosyltransferase
MTPEVVFSALQLRDRIAELGAEISEHYGPGEPPLMVGVLKGSSIFLADLARAIDLAAEVDFMSISAYEEGGVGRGVVRIIKDLEGSIEGRDVLIVEDIVDTGLTLNYLRRALSSRGPASLRTVALLDKVARRIVPVPLEWRGFEVPDVFLLGYGLDYQGIYRNLDHLVAVPDIAALAADPSMYVTGLYAGPGAGDLEGRARR